MKATNDLQKTKLIARYHTLCNRLGMSDNDKRDMLEDNFGVRTSKELYVEELQQICRSLESPKEKPQAKIEKNELDAARKRVIAVLFSYLRFIGYAPDTNYVKEVARKAGKAKTFNTIPQGKLVYNK